MDRTVPAGAAILLDFIRETEVGRSDRASYDVIFANKQHKLSKPLTSMTLDEIVAAQRSWSKNHGSSAAGGYQFMRATLKGLMAELGLRGSRVLDPDLQDRLAYHLLKRRGYEAFVAGKIGPVEFGKRLAMEWASFPVLAPTQGQKRKIQRGQSYYAGDGLNKALVAPGKVELVLERVKAAAGKPASAPRPVPAPKPAPAPSSGGNTGIIAVTLAALAVAITAALGWLADLVCAIPIITNVCGG